jgi:hypothetical protein
MKILALIFILSNSFYLFSQDDGYFDKENKAINDVFISLLDTSRFYYKERLDYSWGRGDLKKYAKRPKKYRASLNYLDSIYYPFKFSELLIKTNGKKNLIDEFEDTFDDYSDSLAKEIDNSILKVFVVNKLFKCRNSDIKYWHESVYPDTIMFFSNPVDTSLTNREFDYNKIQNKGRYVLSTDKYPDRQQRITTKNINEIGILDISRITFNREFSKGIFFFEIYKDNLSAEGYVVIIEKVGMNWTIKYKMRTWQS